MADALKRAGICVQLHRQHFAHDALDEEWLADVSQKQWVILTKDTQHHIRQNELAAVIANQAREFALGNANLTGNEMASIFLRAIPAIHRFLNNNKGPFIVRVRPGGELTQIYLKRQF